MKRVFLIVLDSVGIGELPDAEAYGDKGSHTLLSASRSKEFAMPNMKALGLFEIEGQQAVRADFDETATAALQTELKRADIGSVIGRMAEQSKGKDTTIGHWEISGIVSPQPLPVFPQGFPEELLEKIREVTGRNILCNRPYSGTQVIADYGEESVRTGALIVYTSADSVLQIAAHEKTVALDELYDICQKVRKLCSRADWGVGRVIARPFTGTSSANYVRTAGRHDYSLEPPGVTMLDAIKEAGLSVISIGKISDIFAGRGVTCSVRTASNAEGIDRTLEWLRKDFQGLCFTNLVDYDMLYGHRNDVDGYARALTEFDRRLPELLAAMKPEDLLIITADHGCDPATVSTDHSREYTPLIMYQSGMKRRVDLRTRDTFADIAATVTDYLGVDYRCPGTTMKAALEEAYGV